MPWAKTRASPKGCSQNRRHAAAWCGKGRQAACECDGVPGLMRLLPQTGLRLTSRSRRDMLCATLRVSTNLGCNAHVFHYVRDSI
jgi:hypothetical protein